MGDPITVADVDPEIDKALADLEPILSSARNAAEPYVPVPGGAAQSRVWAVARSNCPIYQEWNRPE
jgi:hypothetical protein